MNKRIVTVSDLIDYLQQFDLSTPIVLSEDDIEEADEFVALNVAIAQIAAEPDRKES